MSEARPNPFLHHIRHLLGGVAEPVLTDGQLLERFLATRDEAAVEVLVRRYGPLVLGVCRRVLHNAHSAEDAFQATFLVLVRKAPSLDRSKPLGGWLYTVAYRLALTARATEQRRQRCEAQAARRPEERSDSPSDLVVALEEELQRLSPRHRVPLVLCYLEGKTNDQAAQILGCPRGSMAARLDQARERLRDGLARRGFVAPAATLTTALAATGAPAAVPLPLLADTVRAAVWFAGEQAGGATFVSAGAVALARGVCRSMVLHKLKIAAGLLLAAAMLGTGATLLLKAAPQAQQQPAPQARPERAAAPAEPLPQGAIARFGSTRLRHGDTVSVAAFTPDGQALLTAGKDQTVRLWDLATGQQIRRFEWGDAEPSQDRPSDNSQLQVLDDLARGSQAALSADGKLVAASRGGVVCLWEAASGRKLHQLQTGHKRIIQLAFAADGKSLLTLGDQAQRRLDGRQALAVWDVATGSCLRRSQGQPLSGPVYRENAPPNLEDQTAIVSPGLKYLAYQRRDETGILRIHTLDLATGQALAQIERGGFGGMHALCFSADDKTLLWDHYPADDIVFSDVVTGKELRRVGAHRRPEDDDRSDPTLAIALSADGKALAICRVSHTIECWNLESGQHTYPVGKPTAAQLEQWFTDYLGTHARPALAFSPDGRKLVCSLGGPAVRQFQVETGQEVLRPAAGHQAPVSTLALAADGQSLCTYSNGGAVRWWNWVNGKETRGHGRETVPQQGVPASATEAAFAREGRFAFAVGNEVTLCNAAGKKTWRVAKEEWPPLAAFALSPDGALLATRSYDYPEVHLWDATGPERHTLGRAGDGPTFVGEGLKEVAGVVTPDVAFSPDGRCLAGAGPRRQLCLWDVARGSLLWELPPQSGQVIERFAFSPSGHMLATVQTDRTVTLYETVSGARRGQLGEPDPKNRRTYLAYNYYGRSRLSAATRRVVPICLAFSPDGRYLAMAKDTPAIHLWDTSTGREVTQFQGHEGGVVKLLFMPDGKYLMSGGTDTTVLTWDLTEHVQRRPPDPAAQALDSLWSDLGGPDASRAFAALRALSACPDQAMPLLQAHVHPVAAPAPKQLAQLVADLGSDRFEIRRQAESELAQLGDLAEPALRQALAGDPPLEVRSRLQRLRERLLALTAKQIREQRAIELLELIGNPDARQMLQALAGGAPGTRLTREAASALERLSKH
jgi:RNA polymerase sigma factor (sigma-70 family)